MNKLIGNTPMIKINYCYKNIKRFIFTKLEWYNLTGSIKDRIVDYILENNISEGILKNNQEIVEATSGNTGISLSAIGSLYRHKVVIFMPDFVSVERVKLIRSFGAKVNLVTREDGGFITCLKLAKEYATNNNAFLFNQFSNIDNINAHYNSTALEIINKLNSIDGFVSGAGSGGTIMGVGIKLKEIFYDVKIALMEPLNSPMISNGSSGNHKIEGIGDDFIPDILDKNIIDKVYLIDDNDAINMARKLSRELGLGVGISSGANFLAGILFNYDINGNVVTIFPDDNKKYLSTDLSLEVDNNSNFISNQIELIDYEIV